jgi:tetratricopeptide (TPR) repeat protein
MSPEQAAGRAVELGPTTDVYGLGATLYEMLTGAAPFQGNLFDVLSKVLAGSWVPPAQVNRAVPPALDAVCRKAMALRPQDRYGSALGLAKDLEAWLADEPVAAYPEPASARLRRWLRKRPKRVTAAAVLLLAAVVGLTVGTVLLERMRRQADASYQTAREGVNLFLRKVSEDVLLDEPGLQPLRQRLLNEALTYYEQLLEIRPNDPDVRQQLAEVYRLRGGLDGELGRRTESEASLSRAVAEYEGLLLAKPSDNTLRFGLALCRLWLAELQVKSGDPEAGRETLSQAVEVLSALRAEEPGRTLFLHLLSRCHDLRAAAEARTGDMAAALRENQEALTILAQISDKKDVTPIQGEGVPSLERGTEPGGRGEELQAQRRNGLRRLERGFWAHSPLVARILGNRGMLLEASGRTAQSARAFQEAGDHFAWLSETRPRSGRLRHELALALLGAGRAEVELGRRAAGERDLRKAVALLEKLAEQDPLVPEYKGSLLRARGFLGECLFVRGRHQAAAEQLRDVVKQGDEFGKDKGLDRQPLADHPWFLCVLGRLEADSGRHEEALRSCKRAAQRQERVLALAPKNPSLRNDLLRIRETLSGLRLLAGEIGRDRRSLEQRQILREREELARRDPSAPRWRSEASASAAVLAGLLLQVGKASEALEVVGQALPPHEALLRADHHRWKEGRGEDHPRAPESGLLWHTGIGSRRAVPPSLQLRSQWAELLAHQGAALAATGRAAAGGEVVARAAAISEEIVRGQGCYPCPPWSWPSVWSAVAVELCRQDPEPCQLHDLARHLALASTLPGAGIPEPASRAVRALRDLAASGFDNPHMLRNDERLAPLRDRPDFQDLLHQMQAQTPDRAAPPRRR